LHHQDHGAGRLSGKKGRSRYSGGLEGVKENKDVVSGRCWQRHASGVRGVGGKYLPISGKRNRKGRRNVVRWMNYSNAWSKQEGKGGNPIKDEQKGAKEVKKPLTAQQAAG